MPVAMTRHRHRETKAERSAKVFASARGETFAAPQPTLHGSRMGSWRWYVDDSAGCVEMPGREGRSLCSEEKIGPMPYPPTVDKVCRGEGARCD